MVAGRRGRKTAVSERFDRSVLLLLLRGREVDFFFVGRFQGRQVSAPLTGGAISGSCEGVPASAAIVCSPSILINEAALSGARVLRSLLKKT